MMNFAGWEMPRDFDGILNEHRAVRSRAGVFDVSHMGRLRIRGIEANRILNRLFTRELEGVETGTALYGFFCDERGGCLDDAIAYVRSPGETWLVVNAANRSTIVNHLKDNGLSTNHFEDRTDETVLLAVQGPEAPQILSRQPDLSFPPGPYRATWEDESMVATTGYTGEPGGELWFPLDRGRTLFYNLLDSVVPCGLGARDTLRLEKAYPLHGHELSREIDPVSAGLDRFIDFNHSFLGREALENLRKSPPRTKVGLRFPDRRRVSTETAVLHQEERVGHITSSGYSPTLEVSIALALVEHRVSNQDTLHVDRGSERLETTVVHGPFL